MEQRSPWTRSSWAAPLRHCDFQWVSDHKMKLGKSGFKTWERTMTVNAGATATVDAALEK